MFKIGTYRQSCLCLCGAFSVIDFRLEVTCYEGIYFTPLIPCVWPGVKFWKQQATSFYHAALHLFYGRWYRLG